jgi:hypothetical protein
MHDTLKQPLWGHVSDNGKQPRDSQPAALRLSSGGKLRRQASAASYGLQAQYLIMDPVLGPLADNTAGKEIDPKIK